MPWDISPVESQPVFLVGTWAGSGPQFSSLPLRGFAAGRAPCHLTESEGPGRNTGQGPGLSPGNPQEEEALSQLHQIFPKIRRLEGEQCNVLSAKLWAASPGGIWFHGLPTKIHLGNSGMSWPGRLSGNRVPKPPLPREVFPATGNPLSRPVLLLVVLLTPPQGKGHPPDFALVKATSQRDNSGMLTPGRGAPRRDTEKGAGLILPSLPLMLPSVSFRIRVRKQGSRQRDACLPRSFEPNNRAGLFLTSSVMWLAGLTTRSSFAS